MGMSVGGLISGMDTDSIISQIQSLQKKPILLLQQKEAGYKVKISAYSTLRSGMANLQTAAENLSSLSKITSYSATSSNTSQLTVEAKSTAAAGNYSLTVKNLATAHKMTSDPTNGFGPSELVGKGTIHLSLGSSSSVDIDVGETSTISDVADAINAADAGVYAAVINDGTNSFLSLTGKQTGSANVINLTVTEDGTVSGDAANQDKTGLSRLYSGNLTQIQSAKNANITVDGIENISRATNTIGDVISGVTLNLKSADLLNPVTVSVESNGDLFTTKMNAFIDAYNGLVDSFTKLQSYDSGTNAAGTLLGDSTTRQIQSQVRSLISNTVSGLSAGMNRLSDFGISTARDGKLSMNSTIFNDKMENNFEDITNFFTQTDVGFGVRMADSMESMLDTTSGVLAVRTGGIQKTIDTMDDRITMLNYRLSDSETRLRAQFNSMELILGKYQGLSSSLTASLTQIQNGWGTN